MEKNLAAIAPRQNAVIGIVQKTEENKRIGSVRGRKIEL